MPKAQRSMLVNRYSLSDENFWPSVTQTKEDGKVYLVDGQRSSLVRVDGLDSIRRLPEISLALDVDDLAKARAYFVAAKPNGKRSEPTTPSRSRSARPLRPWTATSDEWAKADWATIDKSGVAALFNSNSQIV